MKKYLRCHTEKCDITVGKRYDIADIRLCLGDVCYVIIDDAGEYNHWPIEVDGEGGSYRDWFTLETESSEAITLLPDESLGGILREYNEVKRKARVGELVKSIVDDPPVFTVTEVTGGQGAVYGGADGVPTHAENYRVLESSDIIRVDNERLRMVGRKAAVGERVVVTGVTNYYYDDRFKNGEIYTVIYEGDCTSDVFVNHPRGAHHSSGGARLSTYHVLEPLTAAVPTQTPQLSTLDPVDQYAGNIAALTTKVQALEERVATLENNTAKVASGPVNDALPSFAAKTDQQIRDEIVARAVADVTQLVDETGSGDGFLTGRFPSIRRMGHVRFEFVVNRGKRTVTALGYLMYASGNLPKVIGRAKAAPGEVFNVHLGKIIALHRALGLEVPTEYMNVPAPTEVRVGDVVEDGVVRAVRPTHNRVGGTYLGADKGYTYINSRGHEWWALIKEAVILDDSREESEGVNA